MSKLRRMTSLVPPLSVLLGAGAVGLLVWLATRPGYDTTSGYWAAIGILACAGLALALVQRLGVRRGWSLPRISLTALLVAFVPALIAVGWIMAAGQPEPNWFQRHVTAWSADVGVGSVVEDLRPLVPVLAFGLGVLLSSVVQPARPRPVAVDVPRRTSAGLDEEPEPTAEEPRAETRAA